MTAPSLLLLIKVTLDAYDAAASALEAAAHEINDEDVLQAIIGTVADLDGPMTSDQKVWNDRQTDKQTDR